MPTMNEIYKKYATEYDKLVEAEDYQNNIKQHLLNHINWDQKVVYEAGIGTGRLSKIYIDQIQLLYGFDREAHMLEKCEINLYNYSEKVILAIGNNENLPEIENKADIFIEGWSFGHTVVENNENIQRTTEILINNINRNTTDNSKKIIIETLGTNVEQVKNINTDLQEFYRLIEEEYGYNKTIINTDYKFNDYKEAAQIMGFFFGEEMKNKIIDRRNEIVPEYTGIWIKEN
jgi:hypothetical protein